jgi:hypothetical protein
MEAITCSTASRAPKRRLHKQNIGDAGDPLGGQQLDFGGAGVGN